MTDPHSGRRDGARVRLGSRRLEGRQACKKVALNKRQHVRWVKVISE